MYEPKQTEISDKAQELLGDWLNEDDQFDEAVLSCRNLLRKLLECSNEDMLDVRLDLQTTLERYARSKGNFMQEAEDFLIGQVGYVKQTAVDDFRFVSHERDAK